MLFGIWVSKLSLNPWYRREIHLLHHKSSGQIGTWWQSVHYRCGLWSPVLCRGCRGTVFGTRVGLTTGSLSVVVTTSPFAGARHPQSHLPSRSGIFPAACLHPHAQNPRRCRNSLPPVAWLVLLGRTVRSACGSGLYLLTGMGGGAGLLRRGLGTADMVCHDAAMHA